MRPHDASTLLRTALRLDAVASGALGVLLALGGGALAPVLGLPEPLLRVSGLALIPYALAVAFAGWRSFVSRAAATSVVAVNVAWVVASVLLVVGTAATPTPLGYAFVLLQAAAVFAFAEAQWIGLRRVRAYAAAA